MPRTDALALPPPPLDCTNKPGIEVKASAAFCGWFASSWSPSIELTETLDFIFEVALDVPVTTTVLRSRPWLFALSATEGAAVEAGVIQHRLVTAEKVLMQETLIGCINALIDVLAMTNPVAFGRTNRVKRLVIDLAAALGHKEFWQLEAAAMLSQIGYISLPAELVEKLYYGRRLTAEERALADGAPRVAQALLGRIPRIESVMEILTVSQDRTAGNGGDGLLKTGADMLRLILAYDALIVAGSSPNAALQSLRSRAEVYGTPLIDSLVGLLGAHAEEQDVFELPVGSVKPGMIILDDLRTTVGTLLVPKGFEVTNAFLERKRNFDVAILQTKVRVMGMAGEQRRVQPR